MSILRRLSRALGRGLLRIVWRSDPWARFAATLDRGAFGGTETTPLAALTMHSTVRVASIDELCTWLADCQAARAEPSSRRDTTLDLAVRFEEKRVGNCKSSASWVFVKLHTFGLAPTLVVGRWDESVLPNEYHMWVLFEDRGTTYVFESVEKRRDRMIRPLNEVKQHYTPLYSSTAAGATHVYLEHLRLRLQS